MSEACPHHPSGHDTLYTELMAPRRVGPSVYRDTCACGAWRMRWTVPVSPDYLEEWQDWYTVPPGQAGEGGED